MDGTRMFLARMLAPLSRRLRLMIARAVVTAIGDAGKIQTGQVKLLDGEVRDGVEILHQYGVTSHPLGQREGLYFSVGGDRDHGVMVCVADRQHRRKNLEPGEVALYTDEDTDTDEHHIHMKRGQVIELVAGASSIVLTPEDITVAIGASTIVLTPDEITVAVDATTIVLTPEGITMTTPALDIQKT
jgi:phage baseplate assembly protein V